MRIDVHCPNCGEFGADVKRGRVRQCPRCGSDQIVTLEHRHDIDSRFRWEREHAQRAREKLRKEVQCLTT